MIQLQISVPPNVASPESKSKARNRSSVASASLNDFATNSALITGPVAVDLRLLFASCPDGLPALSLTGARIGKASTRACSPAIEVVYQTVWPANTARVVSVLTGIRKVELLT